MAVHFRGYFVMPGQGCGLKRLVRDALHWEPDKNTAFPQFASSRRQYIEAIYDKRGLIQARGFYKRFDAAGFWMVHDTEAPSDLLTRDHCERQIAAIRKSDCPDIGLIRHYQRKRDEWDAYHWWTVPESMLTLIRNDLKGPRRPCGTKPIPILEPESDLPIAASR
jgi:hypothetical protein